MCKVQKDTESSNISGSSYIYIYGYTLICKFIHTFSIWYWVHHPHCPSLVSKKTRRRRPYQQNNAKPCTNFMEFHLMKCDNENDASEFTYKGQLAAGGVASVWRSWVQSPPGPRWFIGSFVGLCAFPCARLSKLNHQLYIHVLSETDSGISIVRVLYYEYLSDVFLSAQIRIPLFKLAWVR